MAVVRGSALVLLLSFYALAVRDMASIDYPAFIKSLLGSPLMALAVYAIQTWLHDPPLPPLYVLSGAIIYRPFHKSAKDDEPKGCSFLKPRAIRPVRTSGFTHRRFIGT